MSEPIAIAHYRRSALSPGLKDKVDRAIACLSAKRFKSDPLVPENFSQIASVVGSAVKRHGFLLDAALREALSDAGRLVWSIDEFKVSGAADQIVEGPNALRADLPYGDATRTLQIDLVVWDQRRRVLGGYEVKRGGGYHDSGKKRQMMRDIRCIQMLLKSWGEQERGLDIDTRVCRIISYYGEKSLPVPWTVTGNELDEHFDALVTPVIEAMNDYYSEQLTPIFQKMRGP